MRASAVGDQIAERKPAIELIEVSKRFGSREALRQVNLAIAPGEVVGLVGLNGAGKTTSLRLMAGLLSPSTGRVSVFGKPARGARAAELGALIDRPAFYPHVGARDSLRMFGLLTGRARPALNGEVERALAAFGASAYAGTRIRELSAGMRQRLGIALAFLGHPALIILDEPNDGLDPEGISTLRRAVMDQAAAGTTVVFSSHLLSEVESVATRVVMIHEGRIIADERTVSLHRNSATRIVLQTNDELERAVKCLTSQHWGADRIPASTPTLLVQTGDGQAVNEALCLCGVFASELTVQRISLEETFLRLTGLRKAPQ